MIRNETEYREASARLKDERGRLPEHRTRLKESGLSDVEIKHVIDPMESFHLQLQEEVESYERIKRGEFEDLRGLGHLPISTRITQGISQRELARRFGVHESQVSRDERNEYFGITLKRAGKILDAEPPWGRRGSISTLVCSLTAAARLTAARAEKAGSSFFPRRASPDPP